MSHSLLKLDKNCKTNSLDRQKQIHLNMKLQRRQKPKLLKILMTPKK